MKLDILCGAPGSGKSTFAKTLKSTYINQDAQGKDHLRLFSEALLRKESIVVDRMGFDKAQRARYSEPAKAAGYEVNITVFVVPRRVCMERVLARTGHETIKDPVAANSAINLFFAKYEKPAEEEGNVRFITYGGGIGEDKPPAIVCDLDGTLCDISARLHFVKKNVEGQKPNWFAFFKGIPRDEVNMWCSTILNRFKDDHEIIYCSGRDESCREVTEKWLKDNNLWFGHLFMRSKGDHRQDSIAKEIILDFDILPQFDPIFMIDDRQQVTDMWRRRGFVCLQCAKGDF